MVADAADMAVIDAADMAVIDAADMALADATGPSPACGDGTLDPGEAATMATPPPATAVMPCHIEPACGDGTRPRRGLRRWQHRRWRRL
ncbi:MAG: hypothetical protein R3F43_27540 [bacterium]